MRNRKMADYFVKSESRWETTSNKVTDDADVINLQKYRIKRELKDRQECGCEFCLRLIQSSLGRYE